MSFTVKATQGGTTNQGMCLSVIVLTNATETGGKTLGTQQTGAAHGTLTPNFSGSLIYWSISDFTINTAWTLHASNSTSAAGLGDFADATQGVQCTTGTYTAAVTSGVGVTIGASAPTGNATSIAGYEIPGISGSPAVDASTPAFVSGHVLNVTTAAFTPPAGAVLVALTASATISGTETIAITDTAGLGLVWTQRAVSALTSNGSNDLCTVFTATMPAAAGTTRAPLVVPQAAVMQAANW